MREWLKVCLLASLWKQSLIYGITGQSALINFISIYSIFHRMIEILETVVWVKNLWLYKSWNNIKRNTLRIQNIIRWHQNVVANKSIYTTYCCSSKSSKAYESPEIQIARAFRRNLTQCPVVIYNLSPGVDLFPHRTSYILTEEISYDFQEVACTEKYRFSWVFTLIC